MRRTEREAGEMQSVRVKSMSLRSMVRRRSILASLEEQSATRRTMREVALMTLKKDEVSYSTTEGEDCEEGEGNRGYCYLEEGEALLSSLAASRHSSLESESSDSSRSSAKV